MEYDALSYTMGRPRNQGVERYALCRNEAYRVVGRPGSIRPRLEQIFARERREKVVALGREGHPAPPKRSGKVQIL